MKKGRALTVDLLMQKCSRLETERDNLLSTVSLLQHALAHAVQFDWNSNADAIPIEVSSGIADCLLHAMKPLAN